VENIARQRGCCKLTLEVLQGNRNAQEMYSKLGYVGYQLDAATGAALFWQKGLDV
jgi:ribosomal protein S18 acetylase RimI-like enzyme